MVRIVVLPNASKARINPKKLREYLLSSSHSIGRFKRPFFAALGYSENHWEQLAADLQELASNGEARLGQSTEFGQKYEVRGTLKGPSGKAAEIVSVWIVLEDEETPRFVTAFPGGKK